jgi:hypothetical protein
VLTAGVGFSIGLGWRGERLVEGIWLAKKGIAVEVKRRGINVKKACGKVDREGGTEQGSASGTGGGVCVDGTGRAPGCALRTRG